MDLKKFDFILLKTGITSIYTLIKTQNYSLKRMVYGVILSSI